MKQETNEIGTKQRKKVMDYIKIFVISSLITIAAAEMYSFRIIFDIIAIIGVFWFLIIILADLSGLEHYMKDENRESCDDFEDDDDYYYDSELQEQNYYDEDD